MYSPRAMRRLKRETKKRLLREMREDLHYLIKPKPWWIPQKIWHRVLKQFLDLDFQNLKNKESQLDIK